MAAEGKLSLKSIEKLHWKLNLLYLYPGGCCPQPVVKKKRNESEGISSNIPCVISVSDTVYMYVGWKQFNTG